MGSLYTALKALVCTAVITCIVVVTQTTTLAAVPQEFVGSRTPYVTVDVQGTKARYTIHDLMLNDDPKIFQMALWRESLIIKVPGTSTIHAFQ